jgi:hypothetical protein
MSQDQSHPAGGLRRNALGFSEVVITGLSPRTGLGVAVIALLGYIVGMCPACLLSRACHALALRPR